MREKMSSLSGVEADLPAGFRFHPRDDELICDYLIEGGSGVGHHLPALIKVDLNKCEPWEIPETACVGGKEWYFYSLRDRKYATGFRTNRATRSGYWKATGKDRPVFRETQVGMRKTLVFYKGRAPKGEKTEWVMHEFRVESQGSAAAGPCLLKPESTPKEDWVLCRVFRKRDVSCKQETQPSALPPPGTALAHPYSVFSQLEQVPCFSITNQTVTVTDPVFCGFTPQQYEAGEEFLHSFGVYGAASALLSHIADMESSSFAEGSSDGYLSEAGPWNPY